jgi:hypothetical protein
MHGMFPYHLRLLLVTSCSSLVTDNQQRRFSRMQGKDLIAQGKQLVEGTGKELLDQGAALVAGAGQDLNTTGQGLVQQGERMQEQHGRILNSQPLRRIYRVEQPLSPAALISCT